MVFSLYNPYPGNVNIFVYTEGQVKFEAFQTESHKSKTISCSYILQMQPKLYRNAT